MTKRYPMDFNDLEKLAAELGQNDPWSNEETTDPIHADERNFYKVQLWTKDWKDIERMLFAGNSLDRAREVFSVAVKTRPRGWYMISQRGRVLQKWPKES